MQEICKIPKPKPKPLGYWAHISGHFLSRPCNELKTNQRLFVSHRCDNVFLSFFKKIFPLCRSYAKEKKERLEVLIDWLRKLITKKEKSLPCVLNLLEEEYVNMLNALGNFLPSHDTRHYTQYRKIGKHTFLCIWKLQL